MQIIKKSSNGIQSLPLESMLLAQRRIFLTGVITTESANTVLQQLLYLESEDDRDPVKLLINSPGGEVGAGLMLYDQMKGMKLPVDIYCTELCANMAAVLLAGGTHGHRFILKHSKVKINEVLVSVSSGRTIGDALSVQRKAESIFETERTIVDLLSSDTGCHHKQIERLISDNVLMNSEEAVNFGICDEIVNRV